MTILPSDHNDRSVSFLVLCLLVLVLMVVLAGQARAQQQPEWALRDVAAQQLSGYWQRDTGDSAACLYGHTGSSGMVVVDSAPRLAVSCRGYFGAAAFMHGQVAPGSEPIIVATLMQVLAHVPEWRFIAIVCGSRATQFAGQHLDVPDMFFAYRPPSGLPTSSPSEGP